LLALSVIAALTLPAADALAQDADPAGTPSGEDPTVSSLPATAEASDTAISVQTIVLFAIGQLVTIALAIMGWERVNRKAQEQHRQNLEQQRRYLEAQTIFEVRRNLVGAIRAFQSWATEIGRLFKNLSPNTVENMVETCAEIARLVDHDDRALAWLAYLEEYESVLPETADLRIELACGLDQARGSIARHVLAIRTRWPHSLPEAKTYAHGFVTDYCGLMDDLRHFVQDKCLRPILGRNEEIERRVPNDRRHLALEDASLRIQEPSRASART